MAADRYPGLQGLDLEPVELRDAVVVVTGGSMGIGRACAESALSSGARVVIAARGRFALEATARALGSTYGADRIIAVQADVGREEAVEALVAAAVDRFARIDGLIHAAAVVGPIGPALETDPGAWWEALRVNLFGTFLVASAVGRVMRELGGGRIVLFSGGGATSPFPYYTAYASSKAAVVRFAESLAHELEPYGIRVNALAPGFVATRMQARTLEAGERAGAEHLRRTRERLEEGGVPPDLAARAAVFLLSDRAEGIQGRLVSAPWDAWWEWPKRGAALDGGDLFTLRRIVPRDRGEAWQ